MSDRITIKAELHQSQWRPMILGDFNGDGKPDLAALGNGGVIVMINTTK